MKKNKKIVIIISIAVILTIIISFFAFRSGNTTQEYVITTEKPHRGNIYNIVTSTGTVQPVNTVSVGSQVSGTIKKLYVDYNSVVKEGELLAELDKTLFEASLDQVKSSYTQVQSQLNFQKSNFERQSQLYNVGAISKAEYENALFSYNSAVAQSKVAYAQVKTAEKNLSLASIYSAIDGTILSRSVSEGQTVAASFSTPTIFLIAKDLKQMQVEASIDEADIGFIKEGDKVTFTVDAFSNDIFEGTIQQIRLNPTTTNNVVTYTTIIKTSNTDLKLKPGMTANITIYTKEVNNALLISMKSTKFAPDSTFSNYQIIHTKQKKEKNECSVWIKQENKLIEKIIKTGINDNTMMEVLEGLTEKDELIVSAELMGGTAINNNNPNSPFMPKRPGSNKK